MASHPRSARRWRRAELYARPAVLTILAYVIGAGATIGYLLALAQASVAVMVPLVATSTALAGLLGIVLLREGVSRRQLFGIAIALPGAVLLSMNA